MRSTSLRTVFLRSASCVAIPIRALHSHGCQGKHRVAAIGSGNWGSAGAKIAAYNALRHSEFEDEVKMWVFEEQVNGRPLTEIINETKENVKYLPGIKLGDNLVAEPDLLTAAAGADVLIFNIPHQFIKGVCDQLKGTLPPHAIAISLIKGLDIKPEGPQLISELVNEKLGIDCSVLMGANVAKDVAAGEFSEATIGYRNRENGELLQQLFHTDTFHVTAIQDVEGAEMCGTLKNIVALGAGFCDGLGLGTNSKAAVIRIGMVEMRKLSKALFPTVSDATYFESCGVADLVTTCFGGRNRKVAEAYVAAKGSKSFDDLEAELLGGQKLQGVLTSDEVQEVLHLKGWDKEYPLFTTINKIVHGADPSSIVNYMDAAK